ncbi:hypothetical protein BT96DRAFT_925498 [Gymnopus androsaceus JB14]|uniref:Cupin type-1 domain-containing protein n=1 Tax=Gymnopus androsaceus JB14 TaxID=1447944 RepID=A0A6A4GZA3_9AGAR|nr:hypothetical protein BT96DRAFT_925498 [Gymnopus androsaceus JB14]
MYSVALAAFALAMQAQAVPFEGRAAPPPGVTSPAPVALPTNAVEIASSVITAPTNVDKLKALLTNSSGDVLTGDALRAVTVMDYNAYNQPAAGTGGSILVGSPDIFPFLEAFDISGGVCFFKPCGLNIPHLHPRGDEFLVVTEGQIEVGFVMENNFATEIHSQLGLFQSTVFPKAAMHYEFNPTCNNATFAAALNNKDAGRSDLITNFLKFPDSIVNVSMARPITIGGDNIDEWRQFLPVNLAAGVDTCLQACGLSVPTAGAIPS